MDPMIQRNLTVRETLTTALFAGARVEAGHAGLDREIRWVHVLEITGVSELLHGGEMVLTTGAGFGSDEKKQERFMASLLQRGVSCLCLELGPELPSLPLHWRKLAEEQALPLIVFPHTVRYVDITHELHSLILDRRRANQEAQAMETVRRESDSRLLRYLLESGYGAGARSPQELIAQQSAEPLLGFLDGMSWRILIAEWPAVSGNRLAAAAAEQAASELGRRLRRESCLCLAEAAGERLTALVAQSERVAAGSGITRLDETVESVLAMFPGCSSGASSRFTSRSRAAEARRQAAEALKLSRTSGPSANDSASSVRPLLYYDELGVLQLLPALLDSYRLESFVEDHLGPLLLADRLKGGDLLLTLKVFLDADCSKQEAARRLFVVRQSLYYRLDRIQELIGPVWLDPEKRLAVQVALRAYMLLEPGALRVIPSRRPTDASSLDSHNCESRAPG
ncbi:hypothetical protein CGZ75_05555 [Paenibacillus herberti]|uniref:PucR family transcriptional regulator n=2 Tax=Paenibacillus herberti TaxID=1619309 RepID=A0A229P2Q2_9BACL|nr:hypothetical protein CGZ75_05555 [Paenibacillus herberti]